ncbi:hypothetical protein AN964_03310 [Heyndrickxia shackletonii]|uniref:Thioredoxin domain-containing protein n=1 Tax=Heyndrickxia shackletonii TaxID=157838 RepID=A0A0Q3WVD8_9BACI|nr:hypothetical protein [Heyndrickxia shackletonii]KQL52651.1 hypothetical protein AN964_03310 [Heyndrickxia shackletonii]NEZ01904.1 hypothetical protein [Heyndrickxia shackletonii]
MSTLIFLYSLSFLVILVACMILYIYNNILKSSRQLLKNQDGLRKGTLYPLNNLEYINEKDVNTNSNCDGTILIATSYGCAACKRVYPYLEQLRQEYNNIDFHLLMLANKDQTQETINLYNLRNFKVSLIQNDQLHNLGITGFPFSYLLSKEKKVIEKGIVNHKKDFDLLISFLTIKKVS